MGGNHTSAREQFDNEAASIKSIIYNMIDSDNTDMAKHLLEQYTLLNSADPEIEIIKKILYPEGERKNNTDAVIADEYGILNSIETIFILSGIITKRTGYVDSVLRKMKLMEDRWGYKALLLTCIHNIDQRQAKTWLQTAGDGQVTLSAGARVINVYEYFQESYAEGLVNKATYTKSDDDALHYDEVSQGVYEVYDGDTLLRKEYYSGFAGSLRMVRNFTDGQAEKDICYDDWGYINYICEYSSANEGILGVKYYTTSGDVRIEAFYKHENDENELEKLILYDKTGSGKTIAECADNAELAAVCLEQIMSEEKFYMLIVEDGIMAKAAALTSNNKKNVARCSVVHSIFLKDAYRPDSGPQMYYEYLCENSKKFDGVIMLTRSAKTDFQNLYGNSSNVFVIPHPYPYQIEKTDFEKRDHLKAVVIARLDPAKQINHAVDIFSLVVKELPDARLEIYGRGPEEESIRERIDELGLENNISLMGYTDDPLVVFSTAALSIFTSIAEGFGLTLVESICNGCPAFAYDIKYGPSEIIEDRRTGFLIPRFDKTKFAKKVIMYLKDKEMQKTMDEHCYAAVSGFSSDVFLENWYRMTETLYKRSMGDMLYE